MDDLITVGIFCGFVALFVIFVIWMLNDQE